MPSRSGAGLHAPEPTSVPQDSQSTTRQIPGDTATWLRYLVIELKDDVLVHRKISVISLIINGQAKRTLNVK